MRGRRKSARAFARCAGAGLLALGLPALAASADEPALGASAEGPSAARPDASGEGPNPAPVVPLERLFELPSGFEPSTAPRRGGVSEADWRQRFHAARERVERSQAALDRSKQELAELAESSEAWTVAPPIGGVSAGASEAPLSYELRQRMKREKSEVEDARRALLDLEVEANLAGVPESWRTE